MRTRDFKLDAVKMTLIILVIFAHIPLLNGFLNIGLPKDFSPALNHTMRGIYAFHMPLFVILSGYFTSRKSLGLQIQSSRRLLRLFLIFQFIDLGILALSNQRWPSLQRCINPCFALWYLLCLFYWRILISIIPENIKPKIIIVISVAISLLVGFYPIKGELGLHRFFSFMPYFMIGHFYGNGVQNMINKYIAFTPPPRAIEFKIRYYCAPCNYGSISLIQSVLVGRNHITIQ